MKRLLETRKTDMRVIAGALLALALLLVGCDQEEPEPTPPGRAMDFYSSGWEMEVHCRGETCYCTTDQAASTLYTQEELDFICQRAIDSHLAYGRR